MARFETNGLDDLIRDMRRLGEGSSDTAKAMTLAAADEIRKAWRKSGDEHGHRLTGAMLDSVGYPNEPTEIGGVLTIDVYPQGKDAKGVRNAEKAFILHYGSSSIKGDHWVDDADAAAEDPVIERLGDMWADYLETGRVPEAPTAPAIGGGGINKKRKD